MNDFRTFPGCFFKVFKSCKITGIQRRKKYMINLQEFSKTYRVLTGIQENYRNTITGLTAPKAAIFAQKTQKRRNFQISSRCTFRFSKKCHVISFKNIIQYHSLISFSSNIIQNIIQYHSQYHRVRNII